MIEQSLWVLDTNILVSRLLAPNGTAARAVDHALERGILLVSDPTLTELVEVLERPQFQPYLSDEERRQFLALLGGVARRIPITRTHQACNDPKDDKFLDVAVNGGATALVTGDRALLDLDFFHEIRIISPATLLTWP